MPPAQQAHIRDKRRTDWFSLDNELIDTYGPRIGHYGIAVYAALCRYVVDSTQTSTVGLTKLAQNLRIGRAKLLSTLALLEEEGMIAISAGDRAHTSVYTLLNIKTQGGSNENHVEERGGSEENQGGSNWNQGGGSGQNCIKTTEYKTTLQNSATTPPPTPPEEFDQVTTQCVEILQNTRGLNKDRKELGGVVETLRNDFPTVDPVEVCKEYQWYHKDATVKTKNHLSRLRNFFKNANQGPSAPPTKRKAKSARGSPSEKHVDENGRYNGKYAHLFVNRHYEHKYADEVFEEDG